MKTIFKLRLPAMRWLTPEEMLNISFACLLLGVTLWKRQKIEGWYVKALIYSAIIVSPAIFKKIKNKQLKNWCPVFAVPVFFMSLKGTVEGVNPTNWDLFLMNLDRKLFLGHYPVLLLERIYNPFLSELLQIAYVLYFIIPILLGALAYSKDEETFRKCAVSVMFTFYASYIGYFLVPAVGPRFAMAEMFTKEIRGLLLTPYIKHTLNVLEPTPHDCFPSGHTAVSVLCFMLSAKYKLKPKLFATLALGVVLATVYHRYHYVVDVIAGLILAFIGYLVGGWIYRKWAERK